MSMKINKVAVLGAGVMGAGIAAHLAGCGVPVLLLDILPTPEKTTNESDPAWRNKFALSAIERIKTSRPSLVYSQKDISKIQVGNFDDDLKRAAECDLVIEVVLERIDIKQKLYERLEPLLRPDAIITSNTSGLGWATLAEGRSPAFRERFLVTHFFNPPRYMKLLELVAGPDTDADATDSVKRFCEDVLGKGVVVAKDTPNFIANRIGATHILDVMHLTVEKGWPIEAVDAVLGPATGRPRSAVYRTADIVGLDTLAFVADTVLKKCQNDEMHDRLKLPQYMAQMLAKSWTGQKAGQGFYKKDKASGAILTLDLANMDYRPGVKFNTPSLKRAKDITDVSERLRTVVFAEDQAGDIAWTSLSRMLVYAAMRVPEISDDIVSVDRAMRWGFNWALGPFETWDALGVKRVCERLEKEGRAVPPFVRTLLETGRDSFYEVRECRRYYFDVASKEMKPEFGSENVFVLERLKCADRVVAKNSGASLIDLGDGVLCCEFHTKMNAIDADIVGMIHQGLDRAEKEGVGLLLANDGENFSVGANLLLILMNAQQGKWDDLNEIVRQFQAVGQRMRFSPKPVVAVPFGMTLGGGCELCLAASKRHAAAETYIGLVEVGVGVIPAGGGCKNLLLQIEGIIRGMHRPTDKIWFSPDDAGPYPKVRWTFETIAMAKVSTSAKEAVELGILRKTDSITLDRDRLIADAKKDIIELAKNYAPPAMREDITLPGLGGKMAVMNALREFKRQGRVTDHDMVICEKLAHVLTGGDVPTTHTATEEHILDLEREVFLSLCGMEKTQARMSQMLLTGKPLRN